MEPKTFTASAQTVLTSLATAAIVWLALSVQESTTKIAVLISKVDRLEQVYADMPTSVSSHSPFDQGPSPLRPIPVQYAMPVQSPEPRRK